MKRKAILSLMLVAVLMIGASLGTYAWFTSTETSANNVFQTGTLKIDGPNNGKIAEGIVEVGNIYPGWEQQNIIKVNNIGTLPFKYRVSATSSDNTLLFNGLNNIEVSVNGGEYKNINELTNYPLGTIAAGTEKDVTFKFKLPTGADDNYQGLRDKFNFKFDATQIENNDGWDALEFAIKSDDSKRIANRESNKPYFNYSINGNKITLTFYNPTDKPYAFDYRVDGENGNPDYWTSWENPKDNSIGIIPGGDLKGQEFGDVYNLVNVAKGEPVTITVSATEELLVGLRRGAENDCYIDWIKFGPTN